MFAAQQLLAECLRHIYLAVRESNNSWCGEVVTASPLQSIDCPEKIVSSKLATSLSFCHFLYMPSFFSLHVYAPTSTTVLLWK